MKKNKSSLNLIIFLLIVILLGGCNKAEVGSSKYIYNYKGYYEYESPSKDDSTFRFKYPSGWIIKEEPFSESTENSEASPDWGAFIYKEGYEENRVYIFTSFSPRSIVNDDVKKEEFIVDKVKKGDLYIDIGEGQVNLYLLYNQGTGKGFQNALVNMEEEFYNEHKEEIWHILASVEY